MRADAQATPRGFDDLGLALLMSCLAVLAWLPAAVNAGFSFDDREAIEHNGVIEGDLPWSAAFERDYWEHRGAAGHFRPLASLALRFDRALWGEHAAGFHVTNVALHALVVFLAALLLQRLAPRRARWPWIGLALFAVHPVLADSVAWISGRSSMLSALPGLGAALHLSRAPRDGVSLAWLIWAACLGLCGSGLACLGKEDGALWALALPLVAATHGRRAMWATTGGALLGLALVSAMRAQALGSAWITAQHPALVDAALSERLLVGGRGLVEAMRLVVWPVGYPPSYSGDPALRAATLVREPALGALGLFAWASALCAVCCGLLARRSLLTFSATLAVLAWFPFLQVVPSGEVFAPRFLYLPLLCSIPLIHAGFDLAFGGRAKYLVAFALLLCFSGAWVRGRVYSSRGAYRMAVLAARPDDVASWNDLGIWHEEEGRPQQALRAWRRATELDPKYSRAWSNLGRMQLLAGDSAQAVLLLERAVREGPDNAVAQVNLGSARLCDGDALGAEAAQRAAIRMAPGLAKAWEGLARALSAQSRHEEARAAIERWLVLEPGNLRALALLGD